MDVSRAARCGLMAVGMVAGSGALGLWAQGPAAAAPLRFDVVSIRPHVSTGDDPSNRKVLPGGRFEASATTVRTLVRVAFGTDDDHIAGAPDWMDHELFDIHATTADRAEIKTPEQFQQVILALLEERFHLKFHRAQVKGPVYWLEVDKPGRLGPALKPATEGETPNMSMNGDGSRMTMRVTAMSMADIAAGLRRRAGRPVEDHTELAGTYDFQIRWATEETQNSDDASLFTALKEQLGLKLRPAKGKVERLVIDAVERPSEN